MPSQKLFSALRPQFGLKIKASPPLDPQLFHLCSSRISILITKGEGTGKICFPYEPLVYRPLGPFKYILLLQEPRISYATLRTSLYSGFLY